MEKVTTTSTGKLQRQVVDLSTVEYLGGLRVVMWESRSIKEDAIREIKRQPFY